MIGGNLSTNAAGKYMIRNNSLRGYVVGLEVVLADGTVLNMSRQLRKDNTGPDLKQLFLGSEGTLGIITKADVVTVSVLKEKRVLFFKVESFTNVLQILKTAQ